MTTLITPHFKKTLNRYSLISYIAFFAIWNPAIGSAQVNSGSDGSDGAFNPTTNTVIDMHDHPNGIYQYTSVNIPYEIQVTFIPNANNTPVTWLVQSNVVITGSVLVEGRSPLGLGNYNYSPIGGSNGPGGWAGGSAGTIPSPGQGPGGGGAGVATNGAGGSFGSPGQSPNSQTSAGPVSGNAFLLPLVGGSGGGAGGGYAGAGGGGAILIVASASIQLDGGIYAQGGDGVQYYSSVSGGGSGGAVRLVTMRLTGSGSIYAPGGGPNNSSSGGNGRIRIDAYQNTFGGGFSGVVSEGFQPIIIPVAGQGVQLSIGSVGGISVSPNPSGQLALPDAVISGQQANPIPVVVNCSNLPLNTPVTVNVKPANGSPVSAVGYNSTGSSASSTATISINMPRGGGIIYATAATGN